MTQLHSVKRDHPIQNILNHYQDLLGETSTKYVGIILTNDSAMRYPQKMIQSYNIFYCLLRNYRVNENTTRLSC